MGLTPKFDQKTLVNQLSKVIIDNKPKYVNAIAYVCEEFVNKARNKAANGSLEQPARGGGFWDRTGNARSSIGYGVFQNGGQLRLKMEQVGGGSEGVSEGKDFVNSLASTVPVNSIGGIVVAGMEYTGYLEAKGYDVITGSQPSKREVLTTLSDLLL